MPVCRALWFMCRVLCLCSRPYNSELSDRWVSIIAYDCQTRVFLSEALEEKYFQQASYLYLLSLRRLVVRFSETLGPLPV